METNEQYKEISLFDLLIIFVKGKKTIILTTLLFIALGFGYLFAFAKPVMYESSLQAMIIVPEVVDNKKITLEADGNILNGIFSSNGIKEDLISEFNLADEYKMSRKKIYALLNKYIEINADTKTGVVTVGVSGKTPEEAQKMANFVFESANNKLKEMTGHIIKQKDETNQATVDATVMANKMRTEISKDKTQAIMLQLYDVLGAKEESGKMLNKEFIVLQLLSPASLPDEPQARGRGKIIALFAMLGFFFGLVIVFVKYLFSNVEAEKKAELMKALH